MVIDEYVLRLLPWRVLRLINVRMRKKIGNQRFLFPIRGSTGLDYMHWEPNWKTISIERCAGIRQGTFLDVGANVG